MNECVLGDKMGESEPDTGPEKHRSDMAGGICRDASEILISSFCTIPVRRPVPKMPGQMNAAIR